MKRRLVILIPVICVIAISAMAEEEQDLAAAARDPTAAITMFQLRLDWVAGYHNLPNADQTRFVAQPIIPFKVGEQRHIARITLPYVLSGPDWGALSEDDAREETGTAVPPNYTPSKEKSGLGDTAAFDFLVFDAPWKGRYFLGISAILPTATDPALGSEKWSAGPAAGAIAQAGKAMVGGIALSNFSFAGADDRDHVTTLTLQPLASYGLPDGWSVELSEIAYNYDFDQDKWTTVPLGGRVAKMMTFGTQSVRLYADAEYNFADSGVSPEWTFRFAVVPLL